MENIEIFNDFIEKLKKNYYLTLEYYMQGLEKKIIEVTNKRKKSSTEVENIKRNSLKTIGMCVGDEKIVQIDFSKKKLYGVKKKVV